MRIVLTTFGSLGDLHPYLAIGRALRARGHCPVIATSGAYRAKVEAAGVEFHPLRPDMPAADELPAMMQRIMDQNRGSEIVVREFAMPSLRDSYEDLMAVARDADLLVSHVITYMTPLVAEKLGKPWASTVLAPIGFFSAYDPPVLAPMPWLEKLRFLGPRFHRGLFGLLKWSVRSWCKPWHQFRQELGLPPVPFDPVFEAQHAPDLVLALFSPIFAAKQPDWPGQTVVTGFPFYDEPGAGELPDELRNFLDAGPPPLVFTLGSSAVITPGTFFERSAEVAQKLGQRAVLLVGSEPTSRPATLPEGVVAHEYVSHAALFPRGSVIVHQGGVGTTAQAMRSGQPQLVMPFAHDQQDNAARVARLGIARTVSRRRYTVDRVAREISTLLDDADYRCRAADVGARVRAEPGLDNICDALEGLARRYIVGGNDASHGEVRDAGTSELQRGTSV